MRVSAIRLPPLLTLGIFLMLRAMPAAGATPDAEFAPLDLRPYCNLGFRDEVAGDRTGGWTDQGATDLRSLPVGRQYFCGVQFDIIDPATNHGRSCLMFRGQARPYFKDRAVIPVSRKFAVLYFLQAGAWGCDGVTYVLTYRDGSRETRKVDSNTIGDWSQPAELSGAELAWEGLTATRAAAGVWMMPWKNPRPELEIASLTIQAEAAGSVTGVLAITGAMSERRRAVPGSAAATPAALQGVAWLDRYYYYRGQPVTGTVRLKNFAAKDRTGKLVAELYAGRHRIAAQELPLWRSTVEAGDTVELPFALPNAQAEGLYDLTFSLVPEPATGAPATVLDRVTVASMGEPPREPLTGANFRHYDQPVTLMIGYVHDEATLRRDFAEMKRKGFDIVCLEWFWRMLEPQRGQYTLEYLDQVVKLADQAGLKYMMYIGFWSRNPDWAPTLSGSADPKKSQEEQVDLADPMVVQAMVQLYGRLAERLKNNGAVMGYVIRLHYYFNQAGQTAAARQAWAHFLAGKGYTTPETILALYGGRPAAELFDGKGGVRFPERERYGSDPKTAVLWHLALRFTEERMLAVTEACCREIRKHDPVKPIRLNLAPSYEPECDETSGFSQIGFYTLAERYGGTINQECFEYATHAAREPRLARHYGVPLTTEGGAVPPQKAIIARLYAHAIENDVAYVAYCHWLVRTQLFEWFKYKPFWKIRKNYTRVCDNLAVTSFWQDSWVGTPDWNLFFQNHHEFNEALAFNHWEYDVINEDLLARGKVEKGQVLLDTNSLCLPEATCRELMRFMENGGTLVANWLTGCNRLDGQPPYLLLRQYAHVELAEGVQGTVTFGRQQLAGRTGLALTAKAGDVVLARWSDQRPAALIRAVGKGRLMLVGFSVTLDDFTNGVMDRILADAGVRRHLTSDADEAGLANNDRGGFFVTLLNNQPTPRVVTTKLYRLPPRQAYVVKDLMRHEQWTARADAAGILEFRLPMDGQACAFAEVVTAP